MPTKVQFIVSDDKLRQIDRLVEQTRVANRTDLINEALTLLEWAVEQRRQGRVIASLDDREERIREIVLPSLIGVEPNFEFDLAEALFGAELVRQPMPVLLNELKKKKPEVYAALEALAGQKVGLESLGDSSLASLWNDEPMRKVALLLAQHSAEALGRQYKLNLPPMRLKE